MCALIFLLTLQANVWAQDVAARMEIRTLGFPPYGIIEGKKLAGIYYESASLLAERAAIPAHNLVAPYARIKSELKSGRADLSIMFKYQDLDDHVLYIAPLAPLKTVVVGLRGSKFENLNALKHKKIAYLRGGNFSDAIETDPDIVIYRTIDFQQGIKMLVAGRVDAIIGPMDPILSAILKLKKSTHILGTPLTVDQRTPWVQLSKKSAFVEKKAELQQHFKNMDKEGIIRDLRAKYTGAPPSN